MERVNKFFIHFWLAVSIASAIYAGVMIYQHGWDQAKTNLFVPVVAFIWYLFRRSMNKRIENNMRNRS